VKRWRTLAAALLAAAALGAIARSVDSSFVGRAAGVTAAFAVGWVAYGVFRGRPWALGSGFFVALLWFWATLALRVQGVIGAPEFVVWIAWALTVMVCTVRARPS
jgi:FtsH-binding integral membrane protein